MSDEPLSDGRDGPRFEPCPACAGTGLRVTPPVPVSDGRGSTWVLLDFPVWLFRGERSDADG